MRVIFFVEPRMARFGEEKKRVQTSAKRQESTGLPVEE